MNQTYSKLEGKQVHGLREGLLEAGMKNHVLWTGSRSDKTSADAYIDGSWNGAFTYYFCKVIKETNNESSRTRVINQVRKKLAGNLYSSARVRLFTFF